MGDVFVHKSIEDEDNQEIQVNSKNVWLGGIAHCFVNLVQLLGSHDLDQETDEPWEVPFKCIEELAYLGAGAQSVVFGGRLRGELVALKKVREKEETDIKHLRKLKHENIVKFKGICVEPPYYCIIMEFCQYGSLFEFLHSESNLLPEQVMKWAKEIALGLKYLHANKIIHRDLKSPNVLIADNFTVKVSDFGTSREWDNVSTVMSFTGTVAWMAPEVIRHEPCSEKVDVWSFGVILWELMTRQFPYKNIETHAIMWGVGTDSLSLPIPSGCPGSMQVLICQCWQRIPKNRPPFKVIASHLEMATPDIVAVDVETFAAKQAAWGAEARESMDKIYARSEKASTSCDSPAPVVALKLREDLRQVKEVYEQQINRANQLFMEVCAVRLQLEQRERALAEREKLLKACRCGQRKNIKINRQSSTSSDGKPEYKNRKKPAQMLVNYIDKYDGLTYTVAVSKCLCTDSVRNNNVEQIKDTIVEQNGNIEINTQPLQTPALDNAVPDLVQL